MRVAELSLELEALRAAKETSDAEVSTTSARAEALELELRSSVKALAEAREGFDAEACKVACLTKDVAELRAKTEEEARVSTATILSERAARSALEKDVRGFANNACSSPERV